MAKQARDWRADLVTTFADLFHPVGDPPSAQGWPCVGDGWRDLLQRLCGRIEAALRAGDTIRILQIKEKFAGLRCYWRGDVSPETAAKINEAIALGEARSACTCEECGDVGELHRHAGRYQTLCAIHAKGAPVTAAPSLENVYVARLAAQSGFPVGRRRYDREADRFIDIDPASLGIGEE